ncbi:GntR family transcriptional regulator [Flagellimonas sp.]|uniref:GntR family transcriptional regulator n=1 Tax=Flagellimonas sp. TaxID=2058762 RepID=UPI003F4A6349
MKLISFIKKLQEINALSKHEQLVLGVVEAIDSGALSLGDQLPSINTMVEDTGFARKTIVKAYDELKDRGLVESKKTKGYFIANSNTKVFLKIALLMYSFQRFQQEFYNTLRAELGDKVQIDIFFHHNNEEVFETIFLNIKGKYGMYVVAPIESDKSRKILKSLSPERLIIVDRFLNLGPKYSYITQEFVDSTGSNLTELLPRIKKYQKMVLFFRNDMDYPEGILWAFKEFTKKNTIDGRIFSSYAPKTVEKGVLYLFIGDSDLWPLLKDSISSGLELGKDIGVLSFNDHLVKEIILGGITTISTDFNAMAVKTAKNIKDPSFSKFVIPTKLIDRNSL